MRKGVLAASAVAILVATLGSGCTRAKAGSQSDAAASPSLSASAASQPADPSPSYSPISSAAPSAPAPAVPTFSLNDLGFEPTTVYRIAATNGTDWQGVSIAVGTQGKGPDYASYIQQIGARCIDTTAEYTIVPVFVGTAFTTDQDDLKMKVALITNRLASSTLIGWYNNSQGGGTSFCSKAQPAVGSSATPTDDGNGWHLKSDGPFAAGKVFGTWGAIAVRNGTLPKLFIRLDATTGGYGVNPQGIEGPNVGRDAAGNVFVAITQGASPCKDLNSSLKCTST